MPQVDWFNQFQRQEASTASPPPSLGTSASSPSAPDVDWFNQFTVQGAPAGQAQVQVPSSFALVNQQPVQDDPEPTSALQSGYDYFSEALASLNPKTMAQGIGTLLSMAASPGSATSGLALANIGQAHVALAQRAKSAFDQGDMTTAMRYAVPAVIPLLGPRIGEAQEYLEQGETAKGLGALSDVGLQILGPKGVTALKGAKVKIPALVKNPNPVDVAAIAAAERAGVPIDAATATGNPYVAGVQRLAEKTTLLGAKEGQRAHAAQTQALGQWGTTLAERASPGAPATMETAGQGVRDTLSSFIRTKHQEANAAYDTLRTIEADPRHAVAQPATIRLPRSGGEPDLVIPDPRGTSTTIPLPVDMAPVKGALQPLYDRLAATMPLAQRQASPGLNALAQVIQGPDQVPLSVADANLSALKRIARGAESPDLRTVSQGAAGRAISSLHSAVDAAARKAGPDAVKALKTGRDAVKAKYLAADALRHLSEEPVRVAGKLTQPRDVALRQLQEVQRLAPKEIPTLARAYLDAMMERATESGGFDKAPTLATEWAKLGPETKKVLFQDAAHVRELDHFFHIAKRLAANPNPSGSAYMGGILMHTVNGWLLHDPTTAIVSELAGQQVARLLHSPAGVKALTRGLTVSGGNRAAATAAYSALAGRLGATPAGVGGLGPGPVPAVAGSDDATARGPRRP